MMRKLEYRENKGFCRLCETSSNSKDIVFGCRLAGKSVQIILCDDCITYLKAHIDTAAAEAAEGVS